ncbi:MAG: PAS domain S-box protein [Candidatus Thorarchaeota archaeon]|nr:PAS domain S-box protein [Candidatus Thorarchaeota archaeon]
MTDLHVLIVEDSEDDAELIILELQRGGYNVQYQRIASKDEMLLALDSTCFDIVLCDYRMPNFTGLEALKIWKEFGFLQPFVIVSGTIGEEAAVEALKMGANDYVMKENLAKLCPAVQNALRQFDEIRKRVEAEEALKHSEAQYRTLVSNLPCAVYRCKMDREWTMLFLSNTIEEISGYPPLDFVENKIRTYESIIHPDDRARVRLEVENAISKKEPFMLEYRIKHKDKAIHWIREKGVGIWDNSGNLSHLDGVLEDITPQKEMEEAVKRSEERFRGIFEESPIAINVFDRNGDMVVANRACLDMFGVEKTSDFRGMNLFSDPNTADWVKDLIKKDQQVRYESAFDFSKVHSTALYDTEKQGILWLYAVLSPLKYGDPRELQGYIVQMQDITDWKKAEKELINANELMKKTIESQMDAVFILDSNASSKIIDANPASARIFGYDRREMIGRTSAFLHVSDRFYEGFLQQLRESIASLGFLRLEAFDMKRRDGSIFPTELTVVPLIDDKGARFGYVSVVRDITEREEASRNLRQSQELYLSTIESTADGILVIGADGQIMHMNTRFMEMWQVPHDTLESKSMIDLLEHLKSQLASSENLLGEAQDLLSSAAITSDTLVTRNGRVIELFTAPILRGEGVAARVWSFRDISRIKRAEESARLYLDLMGHDIRNRLQAITLSVEIGRFLGSDDKIVEIFDTIEAAVNTCATIVSKVKQTENMDQEPLVRKSLAEAVQRCIRNLKSGIEGFRIEKTIDTIEMNVLADDYLDVLLMNLLDNSIAHNNLADKSVWVHLWKENNGYSFSVADNGPGLSDSRKRILFDPRRRFGGVGLHIAHQLSEKYGGVLSVKDRIEGNPAEGAEFLLWLPSYESTNE